MNAPRPALRVILAIALILLPLILVALTLEPLERSPARSGRNSQIVIDNSQDAPASSEGATPGP